MSGLFVSPSTTSLSLLEALRVANGDAWQRMVQLYSPLVYAWCRRAQLQPHDAADIVQEVFLAVALNLDRFSKTKAGDSFRGWLWTITRNQIRLFFRRQKRLPQRLGEAVAEGPSRPNAWWDAASEPDPSAHDAELVYRALELIRSDFHPQTWSAFEQVALEGRPAGEVGAELGMTPVAVRQAKYRVLCRLQQELAAEP